MINIALILHWKLYYFPSPL
jgi:hypothetical protein